MFLGQYQAMYGFGARLEPFYVSSVLLMVFVLFCKFSFFIFYFVMSSDLYMYVFDEGFLFQFIVYEFRYLDPHPFPLVLFWCSLCNIVMYFP